MERAKIRIKESAMRYFREKAFFFFFCRGPRLLTSEKLRAVQFLLTLPVTQFSHP